MFFLATLAAQVTTEPLTTTNTVDFTWLFLKTMIALIIVCIGIIILMKYFVPRMGLYKRYKEGKEISVLERFTIEPKKNLYIVNVRGKDLLIGVNENGINLISELDKNED